MMMNTQSFHAFSLAETDNENDVLFSTEAWHQAERTALGLTPVLLKKELALMIKHQMNLASWLQESVIVSYPHLVPAFDKVVSLLATVLKQAPTDGLNTLATLSDLHWHMNQAGFSPEYIRLLGTLGQYICNSMGLCQGASSLNTPIETLINLQSTQFMLVAQIQLLEGEVTQKVLSFTKHPMHDILLTIQTQFPIAKQG
jgi:hypothetical protein